MMDFQTLADQLGSMEHRKEHVVPDDVPQSTPEQQAAELDWLEKRRGKITCSNFGKIMDGPPQSSADVQRFIDENCCPPVVAALEAGDVSTDEVLALMESAGKSVLDAVTNESLGVKQAILLTQVEPGKAKQNAILKEGSEAIAAAVSQAVKRGPVFSKTAVAYLNSVVAERLGSTLPEITAKPLNWGKDNESDAIAEYEQRFGPVSYNSQAFLELSPDIGGTPDFRTHGNSGVGEVKCPYQPGTHLATILAQAVPDDYAWQVHGHMLITGAEWCDFVSFDPRIPEGNDARLFVLRVDRDESILRKLQKRLDDVVRYVEAAVDAVYSNQLKLRFRSMFAHLTEADQERIRTEI